MTEFLTNPVPNVVFHPNGNAYVPRPAPAPPFSCEGCALAHDPGECLDLPASCTRNGQLLIWLPRGAES